MRNLWTIVKKELRRFFTDKRMLLGLFLPGIVIFSVYSLMGDVMTSSITPSSDHEYRIIAKNEPSDFAAKLLMTNLKIKYLDFTTEEDAFTSLEKKELELYVSFEENFMDKIDAEQNPAVMFHYNSSAIPSMTIFQAYSELLTAMTRPYTAEAIEHSTDMPIGAKVFTSIIPMLVMTFLFSGAVAVAPESIAGEKERGTIASLLITPIKRSHLALGKIIALSLTALVSATVSFIGLMASLPKISGGQMDFNFAAYNVGAYLLLLLVIISSVLLIIVIISIISAFAKSIKEASSLAAPLLIINMVLGVTMIMGQAATSPFLYLIPFYNSMNAMLSIFTMNMNAGNFLITIGANLGFTALGVYLLTLMFKSEKMMFRK